MRAGSCSLSRRSSSRRSCSTWSSSGFTGLVSTPRADMGCTSVLGAGAGSGGSAAQLLGCRPLLPLLRALWNFRMEVRRVGWAGSRFCLRLHGDGVVRRLGWSPGWHTSWSSWLSSHEVSRYCDMRESMLARASGGLVGAAGAGARVVVSMRFARGVTEHPAGGEADP